MRIAALILFGLAVAIKLLWHPSWDFGWAVSRTVHRAYSPSLVAFWLLVSASVLLGIYGWIRRTN